MLPAVLTRYEKASGVLWAALEFVLYGYVLVLTVRMIGEMCAFGVRGPPARDCLLHSSSPRPEPGPNVAPVGQVDVFFENPLNWIEFINQITFMFVFGLRIAQAPDPEPDPHVYLCAPHGPGPTLPPREPGP